MCEFMGLYKTIKSRLCLYVIHNNYAVDVILFSFHNQMIIFNLADARKTRSSLSVRDFDTTVLGL